MGAIRQLGENPVERDDWDLEKARAVGSQREGLCVSKDSWFPVEALAPGLRWSLSVRMGTETQVKTEPISLPQLPCPRAPGYSQQCTVGRRVAGLSLWLSTLAPSLRSFSLPQFPLL